MKKTINGSLLLMFLFFSCNSSVNRLLVNGKHSIWQVVQDGEIKNDSSKFFWDVKNDGSIAEFVYDGFGFIKTNYNSDVQNYKKWRVINDSTVDIFLITHKIILLNDSVFIGINKKRIGDTLKLVRFKRPAASTIITQ